MRRFAVLILLGGMSINAVWGCASLPDRDRYVQVVKKDLLFNPGWTGLPTYDVPRSSWPSVANYVSYGEAIDYRETITDLHGRSTFGRNDYYYRRFESVRTGRAHR